MCVLHHLDDNTENDDNICGTTRAAFLDVHVAHSELSLL